MSAIKFDLPFPNYQRWGFDDGWVAISNDTIDFEFEVGETYHIPVDSEEKCLLMAGVFIQTTGALLQQWFSAAESKALLEQALLEAGLLVHGSKSGALTLHKESNVRAEARAEETLHNVSDGSSSGRFKTLGSEEQTGDTPALRSGDSLLESDVVPALLASGVDADDVRFLGSPQRHQSAAALNSNWKKNKSSETLRRAVETMKSKSSYQPMRDAWLKKNPAPTKVEMPDPPESKSGEGNLVLGASDENHRYCSGCDELMTKHKTAFWCSRCKHEEPIEIRTNNFED